MYQNNVYLMVLGFQKMVENGLIMEIALEMMYVLFKQKKKNNLEFILRKNLNVNVLNIFIIINIKINNII